MDPNVALAILRDPTADHEERADAAAALLEWLGRGGFAPDGTTAAEVEAEAVAFLVQESLQ